MKKWFAILLALLLCLPVTARAAGGVLLEDEAGLLTSGEEARLEQTLQRYSDRHGVDIVVVTVDSLGGKSAMAYADDYYDYNGYAPDGVLLLVSMAEREWWITTSGSCIRALNDRALDQISGSFLPELSDGRYYAAFTSYAEACDLALSGKAPSDGSFGMSLLIGAVLALAAVGVMAYQMKSVRPQPGAASYIRPGSLNITASSDRFLYNHVTRRARSQSSSSGGSHRSSSGRSHGGHGGRF